MEYWLDNIAAVKVRPRTLIGYRTYARKWVAETNTARVRLDQLRAEDIEALHANMLSKGMSETSITQLHRILSLALTMAERRGRIGINPAGRLDAPTPGDFSPTVLSIDDARRLIQAASADTDGARWIVALAMGLRQGERLSMSWDSIDLAAGSVQVSRELYRLPWQHGCPSVADSPSCGHRAHWCPDKHSGGILTGPPKTEAGKRLLPLPAQLMETLKTHRAAQDLARRQAGPDWDGFTSANGERQPGLLPGERARHRFPERLVRLESVPEDGRSPGCTAHGRARGAAAGRRPADCRGGDGPVPVVHAEALPARAR